MPNANVGYGEGFQATSYLRSRVHDTVSQVDDKAMAGSATMVEQLERQYVLVLLVYDRVLPSVFGIGLWTIYGLRFVS